jgi:predicted ATPase
MGVDDVHLLDDLSMYVLHQIVQRGAAKVILTLRAGEPIPTGVQELWGAGNFDRLDLQPLSRDETAMLVSATLGGSVDPHAAPTARASPPAVPTRRCGCGTRPPANRSARR